MPLLFHGPGGGGGGNGYKYQSKDVAGLSYSRNADGSLTLNWSDPEDGAPASEWKGTVVVCKEGEPPKSVDDGEVVCESVVKNQYRDIGLGLNIGGPGYYYGVFPYTKDGVVNTNGENVAYIPNAGYDVALENASWTDIAYISSQGNADQMWSVGDEIDIVLAGDYSGTITMQIAGFNHDNMVSGGKAGITFLSKQLLGGETLHKTGNLVGDGWEKAYMRDVTMPKIKASLPDAVQKAIQPVLKTSSLGYSYYGMCTTEEYVFIPSFAEVLSGIAGIKYRYSSNYSDSNAYKDGSRYSVFNALDDIKKQAISGGMQEWWTRSICSGSYFATIVRGAESYDAGDYKPEAYTKLGICFGFCI